MKRYLSIFLLVVICLTGCSASSSSGNSQSGDDKTTAGGEQTTEAGAYVVNGVTVVPGKDFADANKALGEPVKYTEAASCYYEGMDKIYSYDGFEITTYPVKEKDFVQDISINSDKYKTTEGITVGSTLKDVTDAYGEDYELTGKMYRYFYTDNLYMYFFVINDAVKYFGYAIEAEN